MTYPKIPIYFQPDGTEHECGRDCESLTGCPFEAQLSTGTVRHDFGNAQDWRYDVRTVAFDEWLAEQLKAARTFKLADVERARTRKGAVISQAGLLRMLTDLGLIVED